MAKQDTIRPVDVAVGMALASPSLGSRATFAALAAALDVSTSTVHDAVQRLGAGGLLRAGTREPNRTKLRQFIAHGVRAVFPPRLAGEVRGVPTAYSASPLREEFSFEGGVVWPAAQGPERGAALTPLYPGAVNLPERAPEVYRALALVDAVRIGRARERNAALAELDRFFQLGTA